jgi:hypothetical protein
MTSVIQTQKQICITISNESIGISFANLRGVTEAIARTQRACVLQLFSVG